MCVCLFVFVFVCVKEVWLLTDISPYAHHSEIGKCPLQVLSDRCRIWHLDHDHDRSSSFPHSGSAMWQSVKSVQLLLCVFLTIGEGLLSGMASFRPNCTNHTMHATFFRKHVICSALRRNRVSMSTDEIVNGYGICRRLAASSAALASRNIYNIIRIECNIF